MDIVAIPQNKTLPLESIRSVLKQGEKYADKIVFILPAIREELNLSELSWEIYGTSKKNTLAVERELEKIAAQSEDGKDVIKIIWKISEEFTAVENELALSLVGMKFDGEKKIVQIRFDGDNPIWVKKINSGEYMPTPDALNEALSQMSAYLAAMKQIEQYPVFVGPNGNLWDYKTGEAADTGFPAGQKGENGSDGKDGIVQKIVPAGGLSINETNPAAPVIGANYFSWTLDEVIVGRHENGKPLYRKGIYIASLPNATSVSYPHGAQNVDKSTIAYDFNRSLAIWPTATDASANILFLPVLSMSTGFAPTSLTSTVMTMQSANDRSNLAAKVFITYTKTTD